MPWGDSVEALEPKAVPGVASGARDAAGRAEAAGCWETRGCSTRGASATTGGTTAGSPTGLSHCVAP